MFNFFKKKPPKEKKPAKEKGNYIKYTTSATLDTFDFIKRTMFGLDVINQLFYIGYVVYRIILAQGYLVFNIILLTITLGDFIFHLSTMREFYTKEQKETRKIVRLITKWSKRAIRIVLITLSIISLAQNGPNVTFIDLLMTLLMIFGFLFSIISEVIVKVINSRTSLIKNAFYYDIEEFKKGNSLVVKIINKNLKEVLSLVPEVESEEMRKKVEDVHKGQTEKKVRKHMFHLKEKSKVEEKAPELIEEPAATKPKLKELPDKKDKVEVKKLK